jgi:hypothetical protein
VVLGLGAIGEMVNDYWRLKTAKWGQDIGGSAVCIFHFSIINNRSFAHASGAIPELAGAR